ncbi:hypothetical protein Poly24_27060 [Rosistilla carotiformis]|uniref:Uncharacterized protein n=1 Tax=Rosistilla carotiformis TaxID=2528017 RepID=A0A518JTX1_9BACT|nr:hypothetical protein Poly24_27060 [Rosistilla carotiformis]
MNDLFVAMAYTTGTGCSTLRADDVAARFAILGETRADEFLVR